MTLAEKFIPVYVSLVKAKVRTIDQVPESIRAAVLAAIEEAQ